MCASINFSFSDQAGVPQCPPHCPGVPTPKYSCSQAPTALEAGLAVPASPLLDAVCLLGQNMIICRGGAVTHLAIDWHWSHDGLVAPLVSLPLLHQKLPGNCAAAKCAAVADASCGHHTVQLRSCLTHSASCVCHLESTPRMAAVGPAQVPHHTPMLQSRAGTRGAEHRGY